MASPLSSLLAIISSNVAAIEKTYAAHGQPVPTLDDPPKPPAFDPTELLIPTSLVVSAAFQLISTVSPPQMSLMGSTFSFYAPLAFRVVTEANVVEILREAGPQGLHVNDIGKKAGISPNKIGRILRFLATRHIFKEVSPDVFTNNRVSYCLDSGKSADELIAHPEKRYENNVNMSAAILHTADECFKSAAYLPESVLDPATTHSEDPLVSPFSRAFGKGEQIEFWRWLDAPDNDMRRKRFGVAMASINSFIPPNNVLSVYDWKSLEKGDLVVDVGGGVGGVALTLAKSLPHLRYVIQDRSSVVSEGVKYFQKHLPEALTDGRIKFEGHDFFKPQPIKNARVFFMRFISHDWPDPSMREVLKQLRAAAQPKTALVLMDNIIPYAAPSGDLHADIPGAAMPPVPPPLLPNLGLISAMPTGVDLQMMNMMNSQDRTISQFISLVDGTGWKLTAINRSLPPGMPGLVFLPV